MTPRLELRCGDARRGMKPPPHIIEIPGEVFRYLVRSRSQAGVLHLVDLETRECGCAHWEFRIGPARARGEQVSDCYHIETARIWFIDRLLAQIAAERRRAGRQIA
jgi:hypothetical protein